MPLADGKTCTTGDRSPQSRLFLPVAHPRSPRRYGSILEVARKFDLKVIEDATEGLGATYKGRVLGSLGDVGCFSFNGNKIITTGGGGMLVTNNEEWARQGQVSHDPGQRDPVEYIHGESVTTTG